MATYTAQFLSGGAANGTSILIAATSSPGDLIHTVTDMEELELYIHNVHTSAVKAYVQWGETTAGKDIVLSIPAQDGLTFAIPNLRLANGLVIRVYADITNKLLVLGSPNRKT